MNAKHVLFVLWLLSTTLQSWSKGEGGTAVNTAPVTKAELSRVTSRLTDVETAVDKIKNETEELSRQKRSSYDGSQDTALKLLTEQIKQLTENQQKLDDSCKNDLLKQGQTISAQAKEIAALKAQVAALMKVE